MAQTVIGFFDNRNEAERAVEQLVSAGISRDRIDVSASRTGSTTTDVSYSDNDRDNDRESGITRFFKNLFGDDDDEANRYSRVAGSSECIVTVHAQSDDEASRAADLLDDYGAVDVDERSSTLGVTSGTRTDNDFRSDASVGRDTSIPIIEENLNVGKRSEERGGVRVRSRIIERPIEEHIRLREEHVRVERNPVDRPVSTNDLSAFREGEIELTESAEVPVVNKEARVVEEVRLTKEVTEHDETIRDTVRSTDVDVENFGSTGTSSTRDNINLSDERGLDEDYLRRNENRSSDSDYRSDTNRGL